MLLEYLKVNTATASSKITSEVEPSQQYLRSSCYHVSKTLAHQVGNRRYFSLRQVIWDRLFYSWALDFSKYLPTLYAAHDQSVFLELQRTAIQRPEKPDRHETWTPDLGTQSALAWPQSQALVHLSHFLFIAKVRSWLRSQAWKQARLFFSPFLLPIKTLRSTHKNKCFMLFAYPMPSYKLSKQMAR